MIPLHQIMKNELEKIEDSNFTTFPFLRKLETAQIPQFVTILKRLILNMNVRFFHVSSSLNKKNVRKFLSYDQVVIMPGAPVDGRERCGLLPILDVLNIRPWLVPRHLSESLSHLGLGDEWSRLVPVLRANWDNLEMSCRERERHLTDKEKGTREDLCIPILPNLVDVFCFVRKQHSQG